MGNCSSMKRSVIDDNDDDWFHFCGDNVHVVTTKRRWNEKIAEANKENKMVVANFSAAWCGPCRQIAPFYTELSDTFTCFMFLLIDLDELTELGAKWDVYATPAIFLLKEGEPIDRCIGNTRPDLEKMIKNHAAKLMASSQ